MYCSAVVDFARAKDEWQAFTDPAAQVRDFFLRIAKTINYLWRRQELEALERHLRDIATFANEVPNITADEQIRAYARGAIDVLLEQGSDLLASVGPTERLMVGSLGKNQLTVVGSLYEQPLRLAAISNAVSLDNSYVSRLLKELEGVGIVQRLGAGYALTPLGANTYARIVEPSWAHKARRFLIVMLELLDRVGSASVRALCERVAADLNVQPMVAEKLVTRSLVELESAGRLSVQGDLVSLKATPFAIVEMMARATFTPAPKDLVLTDS